MSTLEQVDFVEAQFRANTAQNFILAIENRRRLPGRVENL